MNRINVLRMPDFGWTPAPSTYNLGILQAQQNHGHTPKEGDRDQLPVLHTRAYKNAASGRAPNTSPAPLDFNGFPLWFSDNTQWFWGKAGTVIVPPRSWLIGTLTPWYALVGSSADRARLSAGKVFCFNGFYSPGLYNGWLLAGCPWESPMPTGSLGPTGATGNIPLIDPTKWVGGEVLMTIGAETGYYDNAAYGTTVTSDLEETTLWNSDLNQIIAALPKFARLGIRVHATLGRPGEDAFFRSLVAQAVAQGIDITYVNGTFNLAALAADYQGFWPI